MQCNLQECKAVVIVGAVTGARTGNVGGVQCGILLPPAVSREVCQRVIFPVLQIRSVLQFVLNHCRTSCDLCCRSIDCHPYGSSKEGVGWLWPSLRTGELHRVLNKFVTYVNINYSTHLARGTWNCQGTGFPPPLFDEGIHRRFPFIYYQLNNRIKLL